MMLQPGFESEFRISAKPAIVAMIGAGVALSFIGDAQVDTASRVRVLTLAFLLYALAITALGLESSRPEVGRRFIVGALVLVALLGCLWLGVPGFLVLSVLIVALAHVLATLRTAVAAAVAQSLLLLALSPLAPKPPGPSSLAFALLGIWVMLGIVYAIAHQLQQLSHWLWQYFEHAQGLLEDSRDRKAELARTVDDLAHAYQQLALANERLDALRLLAQEAQRSKEVFVTRVSHEFRTPLNMIIALVDLAMETPEVYAEEFPPSLREDLGIVERNCQHLSSMIDDVLDLSQASSGRLTLRREDVDIVQVIHEALSVVRPLLERKRLTLRVDTAPDLPLVNCDRTRIRQVLLNLVSNAGRFTDRGGITVQAERKDGWVVIRVSDTGPGIAPEDRERVFEPFWQASARHQLGKGGSGLGLSISKQFVELHDGRLWLESEPGSGTTFFVELPISPPAGHVEPAARWIGEDWVWRERTSGHGQLPVVPVRPRVIICDETGQLAPTLARLFDEMDCVETRTLAEAASEAQRCPAHALFINALAPDDLTTAVAQAREMLPDTPVLAGSVPLQAKRATMAGASGYLTKPVRRTDLMRTLEALEGPVRRVLVVDDDPDVLQLLARMLHACSGSLEVLTAQDGEGALATLRATPIDLMLLDIVMPGMDGWELLACKGQEDAIRTVPVVLVTGQDPSERPMTSPILVATIGDGLPLDKLLHCSLAFSRILLGPEPPPGQEPG